MNVLQTERGQKGNLLCCVIRSLEVKISVLVGIPSAALHTTLDQDTVPTGKEYLLQYQFKPDAFCNL